MRSLRLLSKGLLLAVLLNGSLGCDQLDHVMASIDTGTPTSSIFIGVDISGSFLRSRNFDDSLEFLAHYIYFHLKGFGQLEVPQSLFVGAIGGSKLNEPKTFYPIQSFENSSIAEIHAKLKEIFPKNKENPFTDFNAFFEQISNLVQNKKLILKPISIVLITDGVPDTPGAKGDERFRKIDVRSLEKLSRNVTIRVLYTDAVTGQKWLTRVPRRRVKFWSQDAVVLRGWKDPKILVPGQAIENQSRLFNWMKDNVDFSARLMRVD